MFNLPHDTLPNLVKAIGYPGIALAIFAESGLFFGFFLPGASLLFTAGLLASQGYFNPWILIPLVTISAIAGDGTGYWFGKKVGISFFFKKDSRWFHHEHLERAKDFYDRHGVQTILLARFLPIIRTFAPIVAGIVNMRYQIFLAYNIAGACAWGAGVTFLGYYLGARVPFVGQYLTLIILVIILVTSIPLYWETTKAWRR